MLSYNRMDSFVLAETFKYLFLLFAEKSDLLFDVDDYVFTTEAHLLPLSLSRCNSSKPASTVSTGLTRCGTEVMIICLTFCLL